MNKFRDSLASDLNASQVGKEVTLVGWVSHRRDHGGVIFVDLRDRSGLVQVVFRDSKVAEQAHSLRSEFCIQVTGIVEKRPEGSANPNLASGEIEVNVKKLVVINESAPLPFPLDDAGVGEEARLKYRYLDLRRSEPRDIMRLRSNANAVARDILRKHDFIEAETPTLTRSTPEGARDFIVPARLKPGSFYALPQSPQLFKQLLMVGGLERYFQIARSYRDEDFRADRQPEFTQLDLEMSFTSPEEVMSITEDILRAIWALIGVKLPEQIQQISYKEAMDKYGSDKPDLRFDIPLVDCTEFFKDTPFKVFQAPYVGAVVMEGGASQPRKVLDKWQDWAKQRGAKGLAYVLVDDQGELQGPVAKNLSDSEKAALPELVKAKPGDCIFFAAGNPKDSKTLLGAARVEIAKRLDLISSDAWAFAWVVDFPLFESAKEATASGDVAVGKGEWTAVHHAFTLPTSEWIDKFTEDPAHAMSEAYDIVCNGYEIGGGSMRIHRYDIQQQVLELMGIDEETANQQFGFLLDALKFGAPPHGGLALGWDRVIALLAGVNNIREVIAFPKSGGGVDPLTDAPAPISAAQRAESGIDFQPEDEDK